MKNEIAKLEIKEDDLNLIVNEKVLGTLTTNAKQIKELVKAALPNYSIENYNEDNIDLAKKDKAMLNAASKVLTDKRIALEKEFLTPIEEFKTIIVETVKLISEVSTKIDSVVKQSDLKYKDSKRLIISKYWESKNFNLITLDKIFDEKWLNKTTKDKVYQSEIDQKISTIQNDLQTLEYVGNDSDTLKSIYLNSLNINSTLQYANTLKQNRERIESQAKVEQPKPVEQSTPVEKIEPLKVFVQPIQTTAPVNSNSPEMLTRAFRVTASRENIILLGNFMNERGIKFEKIDS